MITLNDYKIIFTFPVLHSGWECDQIGHIALNKKGSKVLLMSNHGGFYEAEINELNEKIEEYEYTIDKSKEAIVLLKSQEIKNN